MEKYELTFPQKNIWLVENFYESKLINIISGSLIIKKDFEISKAEQTVNKFVEINEGMRLRICVENSIPKQYVSPFMPFEADKINVEGKTEQEIDEIKQEYISTGVDVIEKPLFSYLLIDRGQGVGEIFLKAHHLICDAWSISKMCTELCNIYESILKNEEINIQNLSYTDFVKAEQEYLNSDRYSKDSEFWKEYLKDMTDIVGLKDVIVSNNTLAKRYTLKLDDKFQGLIDEYCKQNRFSPYVLFLTALAIYMERVKEKTDFAIGTPVLNRSNFKEKNMMGMFVSTMPVRFNINEQDTFFDACKKTATDSMTLFRHQKYPYSKISEEYKQANDVSDNMYKIMLSYQNARSELVDATKYEIRWRFSGNIQNELELHIADLNDSGNLDIHFDYITSLFEDIEIEYLAERIFTIIKDGIINNKTIENIDIMPEQEKNKILGEFNDTEREYPKDKTVIDLFEEQVKLNPNKVALTLENQELTYSELNEKADCLAETLIQKGIKENDVVGIIIDKSFELLISIIAVLKVGAYYLPIETNYAHDRKEYLINDAAVKLVIQDNLEKFDVDAMYINDIEWKKANKQISRSSAYSVESPVCILYTSGTTGNPKGAVIINKNITKLVKNPDYMELRENDTILQAASTSFDVSLFEFWGTLLNGGTCALIKKSNLLDFEYLNSYMKERNVTVAWITAALFNQIIDGKIEVFSGLRTVLSGGDVMSLKHVNKLRETYPSLEIINCYGPTECVTFTNTFRVENVMDKRVPLGRAISNTYGYVIDSKFRLLPLYTEGEYIIGGDSVALEYINKEELTREKFVQDEITHKGRMYKTGDVVRILEGGYIDFVGRRDNQVKIRGYRIELDEIQNTLLKLKSIEEAVAVIVEKNGVKQINLYYVGTEKQDNDKLLSYLKEKLPIYMVPFGIMQLDKIPLNQNGKVDRKRLPEISQKHVEEKMNETEKALADIIKNEFGIEPMLHANLFDIGLDSLSVIRLVACLQDKFETDITTRDVMKLASVYEISKHIDNNKEKLVRSNVEKVTSITAAQKSIFMAYMKDTETTLYNIPFEFELNKENINVDKLVASIEKVINNHKAFFTKFNVVSGEITQEIQYNEYKLDVKCLDENGYSELKNKFVRPFDLLSDLLFRINVVEVEDKVKVLCDFHHSIFDGYSLQLFLNEVQAVYNDKEINIETATYLDYINEANVIDEDIEYFKSMFEQEVQVTDMPYDRPRKKYMDYEGNKLKFAIPEATYDKVKEYIANNKFTINSLMQSVYAITLAKYTYSDDVTIGISDANRVSSKYNNTVGMFVKTLPYREIIDWKKTILEFVKETQRKILNVYSHNTCAYEDLLKHIDVNRMPNRTPLFDTLFVCQNKVEDITLGNELVNIKEIERPNAKFDMTFEVVPSETNMYITVEYKTSLYNEDTIRRFVGNYLNVLNYLITNIHDTLYDIEMISKEEKDIIVNKFNNTKTDYPSHSSIHKVFEEIVETHKEKTAIIFENETLTYDELNKRANRLARYLLTKDVKRGDVIGIMIDKSSEYMVAVLGTLKAGLVYMPIVMDTPEERLKYLISNADAKIVITTKEFDRDISYVQKVFIDYIEGNNDYINIQDDTNLNLDICGNDKAYVMYTSGTTGVPKGITIPHKGITRLLLNTNLVDYSDKETMLVSGSTTFDTSGFEIWGAMFYGMTLHLIRKKNILMPKYYESYIKSNGITTTLIPTPIFNQLVEYNAQMFNTLTSLYVCGDVLLPRYANAVIKACPNVLLVNTYGPTENSVICSKFVVDKEYENDISIGEPISNATCYVVDKCEKICPIGVPGDLYTGGDGLAFGYINREELTNEKFTMLQTINEPIYKTGDLTSYYPDGNIKFMGRIDTQIKLRGQRIEILEIQNKILDVKGVKECIVLLKGDSANKFLAAYYTAESDVSEKDIIEYLKKYLPAYMIPSKFIRLDRMPLNQNGKIDRNALPDIKSEKLDIIKPKNKNEEMILECYKSTLDKEDMSMSDDFFEIGGDSLLAMALVGKLETKDINISYGDVFKYTTPKEMYEHVFNEINRLNTIDKDIADYDYTDINKILNSEVEIETVGIKKVLLTGSTGYLGVHILSELLDNEEVEKVYCIVRDKNGKPASERLKDKINYYFGNKYDRIIQDKIIIVNGNITDLERIDINMLDEMKKNVGCVINSVAYVKHFGKKEIFEQVNILGVNKLIDFCVQNNKKLVHISTISVSGNVIESGRTVKSRLKAGTIFDETKLYIGQEIDNVYVLSKFFAERNILENVIKANLNAVIIRVGNLMGRSCDGLFQQNILENAFVNRIRTLINLGIIPENIKDIPLEFTPVDLTARAIVKLVNTNNTRAVYHVYNKNHTDIETVKKVLEELGYNLEYISKEKTTKLIKELMQDDIKQHLISGIIQDLDDNKELDYSSNVKVSCDNTVSILRKLGFTWNTIDEIYLRTFFNYLKDKNFFKGE
ncbi:MAG: amino acid adenylation domain-containing protein [Clostridia bacterium]|nr:amino acid adenylation domain-containing protein [Clostridia bacterium]